MQGVDARYSGKAPARPRIDQPDDRRKHIHSVRWLSSSSEGKRCASPTGDAPASDTSTGMEGISGTGGDKNAHRVGVSGFGRRLRNLSAEGTVG